MSSIRLQIKKPENLLRIFYHVNYLQFGDYYTLYIASQLGILNGIELQQLSL